MTENKNKTTVMEQIKRKPLMGNTAFAVFLLFGAWWQMINVNWTNESLGVLFAFVKGGAFIFGGIVMNMLLSRTKWGKRFSAFLKAEKKETGDPDTRQ